MTAKPATHIFPFIHLGGSATVFIGTVFLLFAKGIKHKGRPDLSMANPVV